MRRLFFSVVMLVAGLAAGYAQTAEGDVVEAAEVTPMPFFGYLSYDSVLVHMPGYVAAQERLAQLRQAYDQEMQRVEADFNTKYEAFLEGQKDFPRTILLKRQKELQAMLDQNIAFKKQCQRELERQEQDALSALGDVLRQAVAFVARERHLAFVLNTDGNACPYVDTLMGVDLRADVEAALSTFYDNMGADSDR